MTPEKAILFYGSCAVIVIVAIVLFIVWRSKGKLVADSKSVWKFHSTKVIIALGALPGVWFQLPPEWKAAIPSTWMQTMAIVVAVVGVVARAKLQEPSVKKEESLPSSEEETKE